MDYNQSLEYIDSFINYERTAAWEYPEALKLDRMRALAKEFGNPQNTYHTVIIGGSKGKGSTAAILSSILRMENYKTGLYTSPHVLNVRERIQVNGLPISEIRFTEIVLKLRGILDDYFWRKNPPTYFETLTAMAFYYFKEMKVEVAVLEVGLGGLFDSTNIAQAKAVGIAPVSLEHTDKLGKTIAKIAVQKCGIIKGRELVVSAPQLPEAESIIRKTAEENDAQLYFVEHDIRIFERNHGEDFQNFDLRSPFGNFFDLKLHLLGKHQLENAALAVGLAKGLETRTRMKLSDAAVKRGILDARWPGRLEKISDHPTVVVDGAHNPESMKKLVEALHRHFHFGKLIVIVSILADKDAEGILSALYAEAAFFVVTQARNPRALEAKLLAEKIKGAGKKIFIEASPGRALERATALAGAGDLVLVTGSLFLVSDIIAESKNHDTSTV